MWLGGDGFFGFVMYATSGENGVSKHADYFWAGSITQDGWAATQESEINVLAEADFAARFALGSNDVMLAEHRPEDNAPIAYDY